jgi:hypothetical protein
MRPHWAVEDIIWYDLSDEADSDIVAYRVVPHE